MKRSMFGVVVALVLVLLCVLAVGTYIVISRNNAAPVTPAAGGSGAGNGPVAIADIPKPQLIANNYQGCPPSGDGGDPALNTLKNRIDEARWSPVTAAEVLALQWPQAIERRSRNRWAKSDTQAVARYEGAPVMVEGYLADAKRQGPESCNCHAVADVDFHIWLVDTAGKARDQSIVVEVSPRVRAFHPAWTITNLQMLVARKDRVRISGWLMMDPEHPDQIGKTRGSIWEIHPIMQIETISNGAWKPLDNGTTGVSSAPEQAQAAVTAPALTPEGTASPPPPGDANAQFNGAVQITKVNYDGVKGNEPDEYVEITNTGTRPVDITGWLLQDSSGRKFFKWENEVLAPGAVIRVYTNERHNETGGFSFESGNPVWKNTGAVAELYDADKILISRFAYGDQK